MYSDEDKRSALLQAMETIDHIDTAILANRAVHIMPLDAVDQDDWNTIQDVAETTVELLEMLKMCLSMGTKIIDNDAATAHVQAVIDAD